MPQRPALFSGGLAGDGSYGIIVTNSSTLEDCTVSNNASDGILAITSFVRRCVANANGRDGLVASANSTVEDCVAGGNAGRRLRATLSVVRRCDITANTGGGLAANQGVTLQSTRIIANTTPPTSDDLRLVGTNYLSDNHVAFVTIDLSTLDSANVWLRNNLCLQTHLGSKLDADWYPTAPTPEYNLSNICS